MDLVGWRWLFRGPVPILLAIWIVAYFVLPFDMQSGAPGGGGRGGGGRGGGSRGRGGRGRGGGRGGGAGGAAADAPLDWAGSVVMAVFMSFLLLSVNRGNDWGWSSPVIRVCIAASVVLFAVLLAVEKRAAAPVIPLSIFTDRVCAACISMGTLNTFNIGGFRAPPFPPGVLCRAPDASLRAEMIPIFLQVARGMSAGEVGLLIFVRPTMGAIVSFVMSRTIMKRPDPPCECCRDGCAALPHPLTFRRRCRPQTAS